MCGAGFGCDGHCDCLSPVGLLAPFESVQRPGRRLHQLAQHILKPTTEHPAAAAGLGPPNSNTGSSVLVCSAAIEMIIGRYPACHRR